MSIQLNKKETEVWRLRLFYQQIIACIIVFGGMFLLTIMPIYANSIFCLIIGGLIGIILFVLTLPTVYYYVEDLEEENNE